MLAWLALLLAACQPAPGQNVAQGRLLAAYDFSEADGVEIGFYPEAMLHVVGGAYQIDVRGGDNEIWWGQWGEPLTDVVIEVETQQMSERSETAYGVMCRVGSGVNAPALGAEVAAGSMGDGYLFLLQGNGAYGILRARGRSLTPLVEWRSSAAIQTGANARNRLRAVCRGDTLSLTVNDVFLAEAVDRTYSAGQIGLAASSAHRAGAQIQFDTINIYEALPG